MTNINKLALFLWIILFAWITVIFLFSSQTGSETTELSSGISQTLANLFYKSPTQEKIGSIHSLIRKLAHIALFGLLGVLVSGTLMTTFTPSKPSWALVMGIIACLITFFISFYDEWRKQFIDGRHFDITEVKLNMIGGFIGITMIVAIYYIFKKR